MVIEKDDIYVGQTRERIREEAERIKSDSHKRVKRMQDLISESTSDNRYSSTRGRWLRLWHYLRQK